MRRLSGYCEAVDPPPPILRNKNLLTRWFISASLSSHFCFSIGGPEKARGMATHVWLRAESTLSAPSRGDPSLLEIERRTPLVPVDSKKLIDAGIKLYIVHRERDVSHGATGFKVTVEKSSNRIFLDKEYSAVG